MSEAGAKNITTDDLDGPILRPVLRFGLPLAVGMACHGLFNCVDLVIVARLGSGAIAAVTVAGIVNMAAMLLFNGIANALGAHLAQAAGRKDEAEFAALRSAGSRLFWGFSIVLGLGFYFPADFLVGLFGADDATRADARVYLEIMSLGSPTMFFMMSGAAHLRGLANAAWPTAALVIANVLNLLLNFLLVFGWLGFPALGVAGSAWATVLARAVGCGILIVGIRRIGGHRALAAAPPKVLARRTWELGREGLLMSAQLLVRVIGMYVLLTVATHPGGKALEPAASRDLLDGVGVCIRLETIVAFFALGYGTAAATLVGRSIGAGRSDRAVTVAWCAALVAASIGAVLGGLLWIGRAVVLPLAAPELTTRAAGYAEVYLAWTSPAYFFMTAAIVLSQALNGARRVLGPLALETAIFGVGVYVLARALACTKWGEAGAFAAVAVSQTIGAAGYALMARGIRSARPG